MSRVAVALCAVVVAAGCGRRGFDGADAEAPVIDAGDVADAAVIPGLVARYGMEDDPSDGSVVDDSGAGLDAVCVAGVTCPTQVAGRVGSAVRFDGTNQVLRVIQPTLALPDAFTVALWVRREVMAEEVPFAKPHGAGADDSLGVVLWLDQTCLETMTAGGREDACSTGVLPTGTWYHLAGVWDGTAKVLFLNGIRVGQLMPAATVLFDSHDVLIGMDENGGSPAYEFTGSVDEVQIYDRALTDGEVMALATP
jgi:hypothetical protein